MALVDTGGPGMLNIIVVQASKQSSSNVISALYFHTQGPSLPCSVSTWFVGGELKFKA